MIILSNGYKKPQTGDFGTVFFPALEDNIDLMNSHTHNGVNGERITGANLAASTQIITSPSFVDQGNGYHRAIVTMPGARLVQDLVITVRDPGTKDIIHLKVEQFSPNQVYLYTNTVQAFEVCFGV